MTKAAFGPVRSESSNCRRAKGVVDVDQASLWNVARRKLTQLNRVRDVRELSVPPGNRLERLKGNRAGQFSIRINDQYRVCFRWEAGYADEVEITDYH